MTTATFELSAPWSMDAMFAVIVAVVVFGVLGLIGFVAFIAWLLQSKEKPLRRDTKISAYTRPSSHRPKMDKEGRNI